MKTWQKVALAIVIVVALAVGALHALRGRIALAAMSRLYAHALGQDPYAGLPDGLSVGICGAGSPMPDPTRAGPCLAVLAGRRLFVIDAGAGGTRNLALMNLPPANVEAAFITHFHSDHIDGLGELMLQRWAGGAHDQPLPVYGPTGVDQVVQGFEAAYALDRGYRIAHHGPAVVPPSGFGGAPHPFAISATGPDVVVLQDKDLKITAFPVRHDPVEPAVGYRFDYKGRSLVISGDTAPAPHLEAAAKGVDLLAHEGLSPTLVGLQRREAVAAHRDNLAHILHDILSYHTAPEAAAGIAARDGVKYLLFYHIIPAVPVEALEGPWLGDARKIFDGPIRVGHDGDFITLPVGGGEPRRTNRLNTFR